MAVINSSDVSAGGITLASQYNNLRKDALGHFNFILGEDMAAGDLGRVVDNGGTPNVMKIFEDFGGAGLSAKSSDTVTVSGTIYHNPTLVVKITTNRYIYFWFAASTNYLNCTIIELNGNVQSIITTKQIVAEEVHSIRSCYLTDGYVAVSYKGTSTTAVYTRVISISADIVTVGAVASITGLNANCYLLFCSMLDSTHYVLGVFSNVNSFFRYVTVSGTSATINGTTYTFGSNTQYTTTICLKVNDNKICIYGIDYTNSLYKANIYSYDASYGFTSGTSGLSLGAFGIEQVSVCKIQDDKIIFLYGNSDLMKSRIGIVSGVTLTIQTEYQILGTYSNSSYLVPVATNKVLFIYMMIADGFNYEDLDINGSVITAGSPNLISSADYELDPGEGLYYDIDNIAVAARNNTDTRICLAFNIPVIRDIVHSYDYFAIAQETGTAGQFKKFTLLGGVSTIHSSLTSGTVQYIQADGTMGETDATLGSVGRAISATEILLSKNP